MSVTRVTAPPPRKPTLAFLDKPTFEKSSLLPMPDSVESFVELSVNPAKLLAALEKIAPEGAFRESVDQLTEAIKTAGSIDLQKDLLAHLGPRMVAYLGPGQSARTNDDSLEAALKQGFSATAAVTVIQSLFPKLTLVAVVDNPDAFGKALDSAIFAINNELKAQAMEKAALYRAATEKAAPGGAGRMQAGGAGGGNRTKRRKEPGYPKFTPVPGQVKSFVLTTPTDSVLRFGPSNFRPTILVEDKYVAFAVSADAARAAVAAVRRKDWKPSADVERACQKVPSKLVMLGVTDVSESLSSLLASLPGTLQTMINTSVALAKARSGGAGATPAAGAGQSGSPPGTPVSAGANRGPAGGRRLMGGGGGSERPGFGPEGLTPQNTPGATGGAGNSSTGSTDDSMVVLKVDSDKLPKAADLKANLFPSTLSVSVLDQEIQFVARGAFPNLSLPISLVPVAGVMPALQSLLDRARQTKPEGTQDKADATAAPGAAGAPAGQAASPKGQGPAGKMQGRRPRGPG